MNNHEKMRACYLVKFMSITEAYNKKIQEAKDAGNNVKASRLLEQRSKQYENLYRKILDFDQSVPNLDKDGREYKNAYTFLIEELLEKEGFDTLSCGKSELDVKDEDVVRAITLSYAIKYKSYLLKKEQEKYEKQGLDPKTAYVSQRTLEANVLNKLKTSLPKDKYPISKGIVDRYQEKNNLESVVSTVCNEVDEYFNYVDSLNKKRVHKLSESDAFESRKVNNFKIQGSVEKIFNARSVSVVRPGPLNVPTMDLEEGLTN